MKPHSTSSWRRRAASALACAAAVFCLLSPPMALGYVRTRTKDGTPISWMYTSCVTVRIDANGSRDVTDGSDITAARKAMNNWRQATAGCSYIDFDILPEKAGLVPELDKSGEANENVITWIEQGWRDLGYSATALAMTKVYYFEKKGSAQDGRILDADITFNSQYFKFSTTGSTTVHDIENTLTHELGHLLGLDHTCDDHSSAYPPKDQDGKPAPLCETADVTQVMKDATMYNYAKPGETKKSTPEADDIAGVCVIYPASKNPETCEPYRHPQAEGCGVGPVGVPARAGLPTLLLMVMLLLAARKLDTQCRIK